VRYYHFYSYSLINSYNFNRCLFASKWLHVGFVLHVLHHFPSSFIVCDRCTLSTNNDISDSMKLYIILAIPFQPLNLSAKQHPQIPVYFPVRYLLFCRCSTPLVSSSLKDNTSIPHNVVEGDIIETFKDMKRKIQCKIIINNDNRLIKIADNVDTLASS
jgi:hypothetical protein